MGPRPRTPERIVIVGRGKAGGSLRAALRAADVEVRCVSGRKPPAKKLAATLVLVCVPDREVSRVRVNVEDDVLVCHVAGSLGLAALSARRRGVFHPLASLDGKHAVPRGCLCAFDADHDDDALRLARLATRIGLVPCRVSDENRARYHAGAVIAANLATALVHLGVKQLQQAGIDVDVARVSLARLLASTAARCEDQALATALTGPVARHDAATVEAHLAAIDDASTQEVYRLLSLVLLDEVLAVPEASQHPDNDDDKNDDNNAGTLRRRLLRNALRHPTQIHD